MFWRLFSSTSKGPALVISELDYFSTHFIGDSMQETWRQPSVEIVGKNRRNRDFLALANPAPAVSEHARHVLEPLMNGEAEFLPLMTIRGDSYYALNVMTVIDCLDRTQSDIKFFPHDPCRIMSI